MILDVEQLAEVQDGEILIASFTSTSWTPVFGRIAGAVTDAGGVMCHAAIVAHEYGLPAVLGTEIATKHVPTGTGSESTPTTASSRSSTARGHQSTFVRERPRHAVRWTRRCSTLTNAAQATRPSPRRDTTYDASVTSTERLSSPRMTLFR